VHGVWHGAWCFERVLAGLDAAGMPAIAVAFVEHPDGTATITEQGAAACFYNDCDAETVAWAVARLGHQPMVTLQQHPAAVAWRERPSTYVVCTEDFGVHPDLQRVLARRCTTTVEWAAGHSPFLSMPDRLVDLLLTTGRECQGAPRPRAS
jgi:hypothetical protein